MTHRLVLLAATLAVLAACGAPAGEAVPPKLQGNGEGPDVNPHPPAFGAQLQGGGEGPVLKPGSPGCKYLVKGICYEVPAGACKAAGCALDRCTLPAATPGEVTCK
jgi:hypothetical protein